MELGVLFFQLTQLGKGGMGIFVRRQDHLIGKHRLQYRQSASRFGPQTLSGPGSAQPGGGAHRPRRGLVHRLVPGAGIDADLIHQGSSPARPLPERRALTRKVPPVTFR